MAPSRRQLIGQLLVTALCGLGVLAGWGTGAAAAVVFGCATAMLNTVLLVVRMSSDWRRQGTDPHAQMRFMVRSSIERFAAMVALLVVGMALLSLSPIHVIAGFIAGQLAFVAASIGIRERE